MKYLLDANAISAAIGQPVGAVASKLRATAASASASVMTSIIVVSELRYGYTRISSERLRLAYELFFDSIEIENWEAPFDHVYGATRSEMERRGFSMGTMDLLIAAHALAIDAVVVTDDRAFSRVPGLKTENWLRP